ncbi:MAG TPA: hypothetical protein VEF04_16405 [Blastocatellia bacterium]|nr:hypothetical protein [Blastocatellia bacterium]
MPVAEILFGGGWRNTQMMTITSTKLPPHDPFTINLYYELSGLERALRENTLSAGQRFNVPVSLSYTNANPETVTAEIVIIDNNVNAAKGMIVEDRSCHQASTRSVKQMGDVRLSGRLELNANTSRGPMRLNYDIKVIQFENRMHSGGIC